MIKIELPNVELRELAQDRYEVLFGGRTLGVVLRVDVTGDVVQGPWAVGIERGGFQTRDDAIRWLVGDYEEHLAQRSADKARREAEKRKRSKSD